MHQPNVPHELTLTGICNCGYLTNTPYRLSDVAPSQTGYVHTRKLILRVETLAEGWRRQTTVMQDDRVEGGVFFSLSLDGMFDPPYAFPPRATSPQCEQETHAPQTLKSPLCSSNSSSLPEDNLTPHHATAVRQNKTLVRSTEADRVPPYQTRLTSRHQARQINVRASN